MRLASDAFETDDAGIWSGMPFYQFYSKKVTDLRKCTRLKKKSGASFSSLLCVGMLWGIHYFFRFRIVSKRVARCDKTFHRIRRHKLQQKTAAQNRSTLFVPGLLNNSRALCNWMAALRTQFASLPFLRRSLEGLWVENMKNTWWNMGAKSCMSFRHEKNLRKRNQEQSPQRAQTRQECHVAKTSRRDTPSDDVGQWSPYRTRLHVFNQFYWCLSTFSFTKKPQKLVGCIASDRVHRKRPVAGVARCRIQGKVASIFFGAFRSLSLVLRTCFARALQWERLCGAAFRFGSARCIQVTT